MPLVRRASGLLLFLAVATGARAADYARDTFRDIRWLGRGNAGIATIRDGTALFYNPAGIARSESYNFSVFNPSMGINLNVLTSIASIFGLTSGGSSLSERFAPFLNKPLLISGSVFPHIAIPGFALGFYDYLDVFLSYENPVFPTLRSDSRNDYGLVTGFGFKIFRGFHIGLSARYFRRTSVIQTVTGDQLLLESSSLLNQLKKGGEAYALNLGLQYRYDFSSEHWAAAGVTVEDLGYTRFFGADASILPSRQAQMLNAGIGYGFDLSLVSVQFLFDVKQILNTSLSFSKKIYTGVEIDLPVIDLRGGFFQGYWTAGLSLSILPFFDIDMATFAEELDSVGGIRSERQWMLGLKTGLDLGGGKGIGKRKQKYTLDKYF